MGDHPVGAATAGVLVFAVGLVVGGGTLELNRRERDQVQDWVRTDGAVTAVFGAGSSGHALVSFTDASGDRINFTVRPGMMHRLAPGQTVAILYPPFKPTAAVIDPRATRWSRNALLAAASLILMTLGAYVAWYARTWDARRM
jgi:hypothetical protein